MSPDRSDILAIRDIAKQDAAGETDDSYARTGDALDTIRRWRASSAAAGDHELVVIIDRLGEDEAAEIYAAARGPEIHEAQLYWDDQDPNYVGWWVRYRDAEGNNDGTEIDAETDADVEQLAKLASKALPNRRGTIKVFRDEHIVGRITLRGPASPDWRAL